MIIKKTSLEKWHFIATKISFLANAIMYLMIIKIKGRSWECFMRFRYLNSEQEVKKERNDKQN